MLAIIPRGARVFAPRRSFVVFQRAAMSSSTGSSSELPDSPIPILRTLEQLREWRTKAFAEGKSVGFVPTMGALHEGHLSLVQHSLAENDLTIVSIFVNPTQFAPHEDLSSYPRTLPQDLNALSSLSVPSNRTTSAVFVPTVDVMYPSSSHEDMQAHRGTFVEVKGLGELMEGKSRPTFFRGVATVVTKLFNAVQPSNAYFGQKDIQQALLLRRMVSDLLLSHPTSQTLHIIPTSRSAIMGIALSSRNAYLTPQEQIHAPVLYRALKTGEASWDAGGSKKNVIQDTLHVLEKERAAASDAGVEMRLDYVEMNDPWTFDVVDDTETKSSGQNRDVIILSGAVWVGRTRLIDNIIIGDSKKILY